MRSRLWKYFGSTDLTIRLLVLIVVDLMIGAWYCRAFPKVFAGLNHQRFHDWIAGIGFSSAWWVWLLFLLLFLLSLNTTVCTADRLAELLWGRKERSFREFVLLVSPSVMHLCFLLIIGGHAVSQFTAQFRQTPVIPGARLTLSDGTVTVLGAGCSYHGEPGLSGLPGECAASLMLAGPAGTANSEIRMPRPILWNGYSLHLGLAGRAKAGEEPALVLQARKDPGLWLILIGNALLCVLMLWYFPKIIRGRNG